MTSEPSLSDGLKNLVFYGKMGAGKSTAAEYVVNAFGYDEKVPIAKTLKDAAVRIWGPEVLKDRDKLQKLGKALREIDEDSLLSEFEQFLNQHPDLTIVNDDLRYPNEWWRLKELGFVFIEVTAPVEVRVDRLQRNGKLDDLAQLEDDTETALDSDEFVPDYVLPNEADEDELHNIVDDIIHKIEKET